MAASGSVARTSSTLSVVITPLGVAPTTSPESRPAFSSECTSTDTSSRRGCPDRRRTISEPTPPVYSCASRITVPPCLGPADGWSRRELDPEVVDQADRPEPDRRQQTHRAPQLVERHHGGRVD